MLFHRRIRRSHYHRNRAAGFPDAHPGFFSAHPACFSKKVNGHHLILGELADYLTGSVVPDTHDERYRQKIARLLIEDKGFAKNEIESRITLTVQAGDKKGVIPVDFKIILHDRFHNRPHNRSHNQAGMVIKYGPGSLITRHRPVLAVSRLLEPCQIPVVVVTNGEDADILDGATGKVTGSGFARIPCRSVLEKIMDAVSFAPISKERAEKEGRIVYAYEVDGSCPCDDTICRV